MKITICKRQFIIRMFAITMFYCNFATLGHKMTIELILYKEATDINFTLGSMAL